MLAKIVQNPITSKYFVEKQIGQTIARLPD